MNKETEEIEEAGEASPLPYVRIPHITYIRAIACFFIVILHTMNVSVILYGDQITLKQNMFSMMAVYLCTWAVPAFLMVTGALQLNPGIKLSIRDLFAVYIWRVLKALILCCLVFQLFDIGMDGEGFTPGNILGAFTDLFLGKSWAHLWYLYTLIGLYLLMPFFRMITEKCRIGDMRYGLGITLLFISCLPLLRLADIQTAFVIPLTTIYPVYLFMGYAIEHGHFAMRKLYFGLLAAAGCLMLVGLTVYKYLAFTDMPDYLLGSYAAVPAVVLSFGVFGLMKGLKAGPALDKALLAVDRCSFGIYLFHMIFIRLALRYWQINPYQYGAWMFAVIVTVIFAISFVLVWILKKIPVINRII